MSGSFVQNFSFLVKGPIRACRRVSLFTALMTGQCPVFVFYCCWLGVVVSSFLLLFYVTAAIFQLYKKLNSTATYSCIGSLPSNGLTFSMSVQTVGNKYVMFCYAGRYSVYICAIRKKIHLTLPTSVGPKPGWKRRRVMHFVRY